MFYRIAWKNRATGCEGCGEWSADKGLLLEWKRYADTNCPKLTHWIEEKKEEEEDGNRSIFRSCWKIGENTTGDWRRADKRQRGRERTFAPSPSRFYQSVSHSGLFSRRASTNPPIIVVQSHSSPTRIATRSSPPCRNAAICSSTSCMTSS